MYLLLLIRPSSADELMRSNWSIGLHSSKYYFGVSSLTSNYFHFFVCNRVKCFILNLLLFNLIRPLSADKLMRSNCRIGLHSSKYNFGVLSLIYLFNYFFWWGRCLFNAQFCVPSAFQPDQAFVSRWIDEVKLVNWPSFK